MEPTKQVLLIDAVTWSTAYPPQSPFRDVGGWFRRHLAKLPNIHLRVENAESDLQAALQNRTRGIIISGSPRDAWSDDPVNSKLCAFVQECCVREIPVLGVCYGHQILARAFGGVVARHPNGLELGNTTVQLTPAGAASPLFAGFPKQFQVFSSHADAVLELPADCEVLATGEFTRIQAFQWQGRMLGVQFHPEQDPETLRFLWSARRDRWRDKVSFDLDRALDEMKPIPDSGRILQNFVQNIVP